MFYKGSRKVLALALVAVVTAEVAVAHSLCTKAPPPVKDMAQHDSQTPPSSHTQHTAGGSERGLFCTADTSSVHSRSTLIHYIDLSLNMCPWCPGPSKLKQKMQNRNDYTPRHTCTYISIRHCIDQYTMVQCI